MSKRDFLRPSSQPLASGYTCLFLVQEKQPLNREVTCKLWVGASSSLAPKDLPRQSLLGKGVHRRALGGSWEVATLVGDLMKTEEEGCIKNWRGEIACRAAAAS